MMVKQFPLFCVVLPPRITQAHIFRLYFCDERDKGSWTVERSSQPAGRDDQGQAYFGRV